MTPQLIELGLSISDNIEWNNAFNDFLKCKRVLIKEFYSLGVMRKLED